MPGENLPQDIAMLWRFVEERIRVSIDPPDEVLAPHIVKWWRSSWAPRRLLVEYVSDSDPNDPELFLEVRDECNGFLVVEAARFGAARMRLSISGYVYFFEPYDESRGHFNTVRDGYLIHYVQAPYALGAIVSDDPEAVVGEVLGRLGGLERRPQIVVRWKGGRDRLQQLLNKLREELERVGLKASYNVYECDDPRVVVTAMPGSSYSTY